MLDTYGNYIGVLYCNLYCVLAGVISIFLTITTTLKTIPIKTTMNHRDELPTNNAKSILPNKVYVKEILWKKI